MTNADGFIDANIIVYAALNDDVRHNTCRALLQNASGGTLFISSQILAEFYSVVTSAKRVSKPFSPDEALNFIETLLSYPHITILPIAADVPSRWMHPARQVQAKGPRIFDLQIAATMQSHGLARLFTYNGSDFENLPGVQTIEPPELSTLP